MPVKTIPCRQSFTQTLLELGKKDKNIIAVTTDARGSVTLTDFFNELPGQSVEVGIAEQNAVGIAAGLASAGKKVFVCGPACFYVARSLEQVKVDVAYSKNPVKVIGVSGGVSYGALGATHHSLHDIAVLRTFPDMQVVLPCDARQTEKLTRMLPDYDHAVYVRVGRNAVPDVYADDRFPFEIGKANTLLDGNDIALIGTGETVYHCYEAGKRLHKEGIGARVIDMHTLKPADTEAILKAARETGLILTAEEHSIYGGLGAIVAETTAEAHPVPVKRLGLPDENAIHAKPLEIFHHYGFDQEGIYNAAIEMLQKHRPAK